MNSQDDATTNECSSRAYGLTLRRFDAYGLYRALQYRSFGMLRSRWHAGDRTDITLTFDGQPPEPTGYADCGARADIVGL